MEEFVRKICICGDPSVGKTSLIRRFVIGAFDEKYISTLGTVVSKKSILIPDKDSEMKLLIWDISGQAEFKRIHASAFRDAKGAIVVCDVTRTETAEHAQNWVSNLYEYAGQEVPVVILINKYDLAEANPDAVESVKKTLEAQKCSIFTTSAKTGHNVEQAFQTLAESIASDEPVVIKPNFELGVVPEKFENPSELLDYITIRFCEAMDDQEMAMYIVRKQLADAGIDFQQFDEESAKRLIERLASLLVGYKGEENARGLKMDLMKAFHRFNGQPLI
ncbi:MAG: GTP-binding protein [Thermoplasmata archaeon]|nr:GTP-binding protein [Thermoplasmata archaeon]